MRATGREQPLNDWFLTDAGGSPMDKFEDDAPGLARYQTLTDALGEPPSKPGADVLVLLARWMADEEVAALVTLVRQATARDAKQYRDLVREVAYHLPRVHLASADGWTFTGMPTLLAAAIRDAAREK
jgi:hypothetical protein